MNLNQIKQLPKFKLLIVLIMIIFLLILLCVSLLKYRIVNINQGSLATAPQISIQPSTSSSVYNTEKIQKDFQRIESKKSLSTTDLNVKKKIINTSSQSGIVKESIDFKVEYIKSADSFMIQILNNDTNQTKIAAVNWFLNLGMSSQGICNLPLVFYLSPQVTDYYRKNNLQFDPIPNVCQ